MSVSSESSSAPIFIVGAPRSGTHLVRFCLSKHSRVHIAPETAFFIEIYGDRRLIRPRHFAQKADVIVDRLLRSGDPTMASVRPQEDELKATVSASTSYRELAEGLFEAIARAAGKPRWGEKTPLHALYVPQILQLFPDARIVCVERDPRNVVASYLKSPLLPDDFATALVHTTLCFKAGRQAVQRGLAHPVRYEALVATQEPVLRQVADYLGEDFEEAMLRPGMRDSSFAEGELMKQSKDMGIIQDPNDADKWRSVLSEEQAEWVQQAVAGVRPSMPRAERASLARSTLVHRLMHTRNRLGFFGLKRSAASGRRAL